MPHPAAIALHTHLEEAFGRAFGDGFEPEAAGVGVGAYHGDGVSRFPGGADGEGDEGGAVAGEVVFVRRLEGGLPVVAFFDMREARGFEALFGRVDGVEGWNRLCQLISATLLYIIVLVLRVGEALRKVTKSSARLSDALPAMLLLNRRVLMCPIPVNVAVC